MLVLVLLPKNLSKTIKKFYKDKKKNLKIKPMTNLELILVILLSISALLNVGLIIYVRKAIVELLSISEELYDIKDMTETFGAHIQEVYELEMFYGDQTLGNLLDHAKSFAEQLETFEYIYDLIEKEVDEDENLTNDTTETEESKT